MRLADFGRDAVLVERAFHPRHQIAAIGIVVGMLQLAAAALGKVAARRHLVMRAVLDVAISPYHVAGDRERHMAAVIRDAIAARGDPDDRFTHNVVGMAAAKSSAIIPGPAASAARPCSHTPAQAASNACSPRARIAAMIPARTSPVPAVASQGGAGGAKPS